MKRPFKNYTFERSEIFIMFLLLLFGSVLVFSIGVMLGKRLLENECRLILEDNENKLQECQALTVSNAKTDKEPVPAKQENPDLEGTDKKVEEPEVIPADPFIKKPQMQEPAKKEETKKQAIQQPAPIKKELPSNLNLKSPIEEKKIVEPSVEESEMEHLGITKITDDIKNKYTVQISAHRDEAEAKQIASDLYVAGFKSSYYLKTEIPNKGTWYRVGIGFFPKKDSAELFADMLKKQGKISSYIIRKID
jgi:cell division protein FtsN